MLTVSPDLSQEILSVDGWQLVLEYLLSLPKVSYNLQVLFVFRHNTRLLSEWTHQAPRSVRQELQSGR